MVASEVGVEQERLTRRQIAALVLVGATIVAVLRTMNAGVLVRLRIMAAFVVVCSMGFIAWSIWLREGGE